MAEQTIFITGATGGLGSVVVPYFLDRGWRVIAVLSEENAKNKPESHPMLDVQVVDLTDERAVGTLISWLIQTYGGIDAALLLAGGFVAGGVADATGNEVKTMFAINFETAYYAVRPVYNQMLERGKGRIILVGARPALDPSAGKTSVAYALSKSLLFQLAEILNADAKGKDVVTHVVVPSIIDTPNNRKWMAKADFDSWVKPEQLAEIFNFICSDGSAPLRDPVWKVYNNA
ncbi:MAG TPA: SDR family NAD(P)-dependent oxidoreductase [Puia sp.]|jgi:NAD(P)-dependent dehydrogenase (short-subunit alcohol dehydrogenase family)|nr:SDR family NAD(P)-dependent oxidoreductase [Puia sp.]